VNETPEAQCLTSVEARLSLLPEGSPSAARDAELGLRAVWAGEGELLPEGRPMLELEPASLVLTSFKPAREDGCAVLRVLNPTAESVTAHLRLGVQVSALQTLRLDEQPEDFLLSRDADEWRFELGPKQVRTLLLRR
jgi:alpha-mannosidase